MTKTPRLIISVLLFPLLSSVVYAQDMHLNATSRVDWQEGILAIDISADIATRDSPGQARTAFEQLLRREIGTIFCSATYVVYLDSYHTIKQAVEENNSFLASLIDVGKETPPSSIHLNTSLDSLTASFRFQLYPDVIQVFIHHWVPYDPAPVLEFVPTIDYSGVVIYAKGEYPVHGEDPVQNSPEPFHPSLMPKLFDMEMEIVAEAEMMDPDQVSTWGVFGYTDSTDYLDYQDRIGTTPLLTMAGAVFGDYRTDLLIPLDAAKKILATPANRELIRQGRILIICDLPVTTTVID